MTARTNTVFRSCLTQQWHRRKSKRYLLRTSARSSASGATLCLHLVHPSWGMHFASMGRQHPSFIMSLTCTSNLHQARSSRECVRPAWRMHVCSLTNGHGGMSAAMLRRSFSAPLLCPRRLIQRQFRTQRSVSSSLRNQHGDVVRDALDLAGPNWLLQWPRPQVCALLHATQVRSSADPLPACHTIALNYCCLVCCR